MKKNIFLCLFSMVLFMIGCTQKSEIEIYSVETPIHEINKIVTFSEMEKIYEKYQNGFGGRELYLYLKEIGIYKYRIVNDNFIYTVIQISDIGKLYVFLENVDSKYMVSYLIFKEKIISNTKEDFGNKLLNNFTIQDVIEIDKYAKFNILYTSSIGTISTHFLTNDIIARIYYSTDIRSTIVEIKYETKDKCEISYIKYIKSIDW